MDPMRFIAEEVTGGGAAAAGAAEAGARGIAAARAAGAGERLPCHCMAASDDVAYRGGGERQEKAAAVQQRQVNQAQKHGAGLHWLALTVILVISYRGFGLTGARGCHAADAPARGVAEAAAAAGERLPTYRVYWCSDTHC